MDKNLYCIVGTVKATGIRKCLSGSFFYSTKENAQNAIKEFTGTWGKKTWKYVKVAKYPYKPRKHGVVI